MGIPTSPIPDGLAQVHLVLDADLSDRLASEAEKRGIDVATYISWLMARVVISPELD
jgi:hypothetical protein